MPQYLIRVNGRLPDDLLEGFENLAVAPQGVQTVLYGDLADQPALAGILDRLAELGIVVVEVFQVPAGSGQPDEPSAPRSQFG